MLVSILTVYYNRADQVEESIQSLLSQTYRNMEIIVVDDGSTDRTLEKLSQYNDPRLRIITHSNRGFTRSIIEAVRQSRGELIAIHGSGDYSYPDRIEKQVRLLQARPQVGVVGCHVENANKVTGTSALFHKFNPNESAVDQLLRYNIFTHGEVMFRRSVYNQAGGYRELFKFTQDYDLWLRMALCTQFATIDEVLYRRYTLPDGVSASTEKMLVQRYLAEFARQCLEQRRKSGEDWIDRYGEHSMFFMEKSKRLARSLRDLARIAALQDKDLPKAQRLIRLSLQEQSHLLGVICSWGLSIMIKHSAIKRLGFSALENWRGARRKLAGGKSRVPER
ncbi:glycosyltransferase [Paenibacillus senegalensis]|uniref:glycosyltransferase n=1 Tax=Paenibacillus senegalensis TaxID=1465766 RepID=UPI000289645D|nr:glycosyltransferase [Paenibacillus senegalensis]